jgi:hypothetical protein
MGQMQLRNLDEQQIAADLPREPSFTPDELSEVLSEAIARQGGGGRGEGLATLDDALEVAGQLSIPRQHVLTAARDLRRRKLRAQRRMVLRRRRRAMFGELIGPIAVVAAVWMVASLLFEREVPSSALVLLFALVHTLAKGVKWFFFPAPDEEDDMD